MMDFANLNLEYFNTRVEDGVGLLEINRPPANAHNLEVLQELDRAIMAIRFDESVKVVIFTSALPKFFSAGFDITVLRDSTPEYVGLSSQFSKEVMLKIQSTRKIFIAAINGHCMGGGLELAMACDLRFAIDDARVKLGMPEINLGLIPGEGGTQMLGRLVGKSKALYLMITGETFDPNRALELGIVDKLFHQDELMPETFAFAKKLAQGPALAIGFNKLALNEALDLPIGSALAFERELQNQALASQDAKEGSTAFTEKRAPKFTGH
ncbi:enoyl-CoA hydratase/isomerase family protein [Sulfobacillus thermosulfidooxidans]|uniref:enoyl-CoA hydratase/isomerase family protein n=1 Tax=Sulfobacillus thermosulfidooxidans TaxID=28034 RepID=UPI0002D368F0|nr:enoyl-CoA hydratase/isomerase family protein [Sulfobacillus thermosulfidooxidans]